MSMVDVAEAAVVRRGFNPRWGKTTTTTIEDEQPDMSIASGEAPQHATWGQLFIALLAQRMESPVPPTIGKVLLFEGVPGEAERFEGTVGSSGIVTHFFNDESPWLRLLRQARAAARLRHLNVASVSWAGLVSPPVVSSAFHADELLDWDFTVEAAPKRLTGTLAVTLKYVARGSSAPFEDPGD